jgi:hypothetical protein
MKRVEEAARVAAAAFKLRDSKKWDSIDAFKEQLVQVNNRERTTPCGIPLPLGVVLRTKLEDSIHALICVEMDFYPKHTIDETHKKTRIRVGTFARYIERDPKMREIVEEAGRVAVAARELRDSQKWESLIAFKMQLKQLLPDTDVEFRSRFTPCGIKLPRGVCVTKKVHQSMITAQVCYDGWTMYLGTFGQYVERDPKMREIDEEAGRVAVAARELRDSQKWNTRDDFVKQLAINKLRRDHFLSEAEIERNDAISMNHDAFISSFIKNDGTRCLLERQQVDNMNDFRYSEDIVKAYEKYDSLSVLESNEEPIAPVPQFAEGSILPDSVLESNEEPIAPVPQFAEGSIVPDSVLESNEEPIAPVPQFAEGSIVPDSVLESNEEPIAPVPQFAEV